MRVIVRRSALARALEFVDDLAAPRQLLEFTTGAVLSVDKDRLLVSATDGQLWVQTEMDADVANCTCPSVGLDGRLLGHLVSKVNSDELVISGSPTHALIQAGGNEYRLRAFDPETFPSQPEAHYRQEVELPAECFRDVVLYLEEVPKSDDISRPFLGGISITTVDGQLRATATDGRRFAFYQVFSRSIPGGLGMVLPAKALRKLADILGDSDELLSLAGNSQVVRFTCRAARLTCNLIPGFYPQLHAKMPTDRFGTVRVGKTLLIRAIERLLLFNKVYGHAPVTLSVTGSEAIITAEVPEIGDVEEHVPLLSSDGECFTVSLNAKFIMDTLKTPIPDPIDVSYYGGKAPVSLTSPGAHYACWMLPLLEV